MFGSSNVLHSKIHVASITRFLGTHAQIQQKIQQHAQTSAIVIKYVQNKKSKKYISKPQKLTSQPTKSDSCSRSAQLCAHPESCSAQGWISGCSLDPDWGWAWMGWRSVTFPHSFPTGVGSSRSTGSTSQVGIAGFSRNFLERSLAASTGHARGQKAKLLQAQMLQELGWEKEEL